ncbi:MAG: DUF3854 domain-containing protein, partial [Spirulinaceae cyanobacterium SM2_1_0]|nr:DUF3854 domain-containing protein [Spirulinaceae cyanobacterium SM2_1_0]
MNRPPNILPEHWREWVEGSAIDPAIAALNLRSIECEQVYDLLCSEISDFARADNPRMPRERYIRRYAAAYRGGWWCSGIDLTDPASPYYWGQMKPDSPHVSRDGKALKYEAPAKSGIGVFALRVPYRIGLAIAKSGGCEAEYLQRMGAHDPNSEDCEFWDWARRCKALPLILSEGSKKAGAGLTAGYASISGCGVDGFAIRPKDSEGKPYGAARLIPEMEAIDWEGRSVHLAFDRDTKPSARARVVGSNQRLARLLRARGADVRFATWQSRCGKGLDDVLASQGANAIHMAIAKARLSCQWQAEQMWELNHPPAVTVNERYLNQPIPRNKRLICIKSPKGTGKTQALERIVGKIIQARESSDVGRILLITHRVQLGMALAKRLGIPYITERRNDEFGDLFGFGLCFDSLHPMSQARFSPEDWAGCTIIIDECEQAIWHALTSATCASDRPAILSALAAVAANAERVILADADLSSATLNLFRSLMAGDGERPDPWILLNEWLPSEAPKVTMYGGNDPREWLASLLLHVADGGKPFILTGGQRASSLSGTQVLEAALKETDKLVRNSENSLP